MMSRMGLVPEGYRSRNRIPGTRCLSLTAILASSLAGTMLVVPAARAEPVVRSIGVDGGPVDGTGADLVAAAQERGVLEVIVRVAVPPAGTASARGDEEAQIASAQQRVLGAVPNARNVYRFSAVPFVSMLVTAGDLRTLLADPNVATISRNVLFRSSGGDGSVELAQKNINKIIGANALHKQGITGKNKVVVIPDTGVDYNHPLLAGAMKKEACFSTKVSGQAQTFCPNGKSVDEGPGSGLPCPIAEFEDCGRGTDLASIVTASPPSGLNVGVAPDSRLFAVQIFRRQLLAGDCTPDPAPCIRSNVTDLAKALNWVVKQAGLAGGKQIVAVPIGLAGGNFTTFCDSTADPLVALIQKLVNRNISVYVGAGDIGLVNGIGYPACLSRAIAVGGTGENDVPDPTANRWSGPMILAPDIVDSLVESTAIEARKKKRRDTPRGASVAAAARTLSDADHKRTREAGFCTGKVVEDTTREHNRLNLPNLRKRARKARKNLVRTFTTTAAVDKVSPRQGKCKLKNNRLFCNNAGNSFYIHAESNICAADEYDITIKFRHNDPDTLVHFPGGLLIGATTKGRYVNGNFFSTFKGAGGFGEIRQLRNYDLTTGAGVATTLCQGPAPHDPKKFNKLRAVGSSRKLTLYLNGTKVCTTENALFIAGMLAFTAGKPQTGTTHNIEIESLTMKNAIDSPIPK